MRVPQCLPGSQADGRLLGAGVQPDVGDLLSVVYGTVDLDDFWMGVPCMKTDVSAGTVAAIGYLLITAQVAADRRQTFKRVQSALEKLSSRTSPNTTNYTDGQIELDRADWEWIEALASTCPSWPGQMVLLDADESLRSVLTSVLNGSGNGTKGP